MHVTTQKQLLKEDRYLNKEERLAFCRYVLNIAGSCVFVGLLITMPKLNAVFGWVEE